MAIFVLRKAPTLNKTAETQPHMYLDDTEYFQFDLFVVHMCLLSVLVSEIMHHKFPHLVQKHNYSMANSTSKKMENWYYLNR